MSVDVEAWSPAAREEINAWRLLLTPTHVRLVMLDHLRTGERYELRGLYEVLDENNEPRPAMAVVSSGIIDGVLFERGWFVVSDGDARLTVLERGTTRLIRDKALGDLVDGWLQAAEVRTNRVANELAGGDVAAKPLADGVQLAADGAGAGPASARDLFLRATLAHKSENADLGWGKRLRHRVVALLTWLLLRLA